MSQIRIELIDAVELAEMLTFIASWLSGSQRPTLADSLASYVGHPAYDLDELTPTCTDSCSCSAKATAKTSSENPHHDPQHRRSTARA